MNKGMLVLAVMALGCGVVGCGATGPPGSGLASVAVPAATGRGPITVGSKIDTEGELLSEIILQVLENAGFRVNDRSQTGPTDVVRAALLSGEIDIYPEYTGSGLVFFEDSDPAVFRDGERGYELVKRLDLERNRIVWLTPARANNTWAIATRQDFAAAKGLKTMSDFAAYLRAGKPARLAASAEFFASADANPAFERTYGYRLTEEQKLVFTGGNTAQTEQAVADGLDGANFGMAYGTDGALAKLGLVVLADDEGAQPVYWPVPVARLDVIERYPELEGLLKPVFAALAQETLRTLNGRIQVDGEAAAAVARGFLTTGRFLK